MSANLNDLLTRFQTDVGLVHDFVKGDATVTVVGTNGSYPSLAKLAAEYLAGIGNFTSNSQATIDQLITSANAEIAALITSAQNTGGGGGPIDDTAALAAIQAAEAAALLSISTAVLNELASFDSGGLNTIITNTQASIDALIASGQSQITTLLNSNQSALSAMVSSAQAGVNYLINNSQSAVNQFLANGQAEVNSLISASQSALTTIEALGQTDISNLVTQTQTALTTNTAALVASQAAIANMLNEAHGTVAAVFKIQPASLAWTIQHNMNTKLFSTTIKKDSGVTVYENSINIVNNNEFILNFTEAESGTVYVVFYLGKCGC